MDGNVDIKRLVGQLLDLRELHEQLLLAVRSKQQSMRRGQTSALESWSAREKFLLDRISEAEQNRREQVRKVSEQLNINDTPTVSRLAAAFDEPERSQLLVAAGAIRDLAEAIVQVNRVNDAVTREVLECFAQVRRQFAASQCDIGLYDLKGQRQLSGHVSILDAVG